VEVTFHQDRAPGGEDWRSENILWSWVSLTLPTKHSSLIVGRTQKKAEETENSKQIVFMGLKKPSISLKIGILRGLKLYPIFLFKNKILMY
jgi:hypothetical protein